VDRVRDRGEDSMRPGVEADRLAPDRRPDPRSSKFVGYFHLVEACAKAGCPVCYCLRELTARHLDALLTGHVTDPTTRERLAQSWGFCAAHAEVVREVPDAALGVGIVYHELLSQARRWLTQAQRELSLAPARRGWRRLFGRPRPKGPADLRRGGSRCPACVALAAAERSYVETLLTFVEDPELDGAYGRSAGLCLPHLRLALTQARGHPGAAPFVARTLQKVDRLAEELHRFIDKHDHRATASFTEREAQAWTNALGFVAGRPELFGNEIPRPPASGET